MYFAVWALLTPLIIGLSWQSLFRRKLVLSVEEYLLGVSIILIGLGFCAWYSPNQSKTFIFCSVTISMLILIWQMVRKRLVLRLIQIDSSILHFFSLVTFFFIFILQGKIHQRFFVNPDPYGYASVTGLIKRYGGLPEGLKSIESFTGVPFSYGASWTDPSQFELISSPFHISDFLIKYGVSNGMFFHNAGSVIGLLFGNQAPREFFDMWAIVTVISISLIICLCSKVSLVLVNSLTASLKELGKNSSSYPKKAEVGSSLKPKTVWFVNLLVTSIFLGSVWLIPMVWEGYLNQFVSYSLILGVFLVSLRIGFELMPTTSTKYMSRRKTKNHRQELKKVEPEKPQYWTASNRLKVLELISAIILFVAANVVAYAQQIPWQILALAAVILFFGWDWVFSRAANLLAILITLLTLVAIAFTLPQTKRGLTMFLGGGESAGGSMHLGAFNPIRVFLPLLNYDLVKVTNPGQDGVQNFSETIWVDYFGPGANATMRGQGYVYIAEDINGMYFTSILLLIVLFFLIKIIGSGQRYMSLVGICAVLIFANIFYLYNHTGPGVIENMNKAFNSYMWVRLWAVTSIFYVPIFVALLTAVCWKYFSSAISFLIGVALSLLLSSATYAAQYSQNLDNYSISASVSDECPSLLLDRGKNYYISNVIVPMLGITVCGENMEFLSDSFPSNHEPGAQRSVINISRNVPTDKWDFQQIGALQLSETLTSPCDFRCVTNLPGFVPKTNTAKS
jgi:hypothetical protein